MGFRGEKQESPCSRTCQSEREGSRRVAHTVTGHVPQILEQMLETEQDVLEPTPQPETGMFSNRNVQVLNTLMEYQTHSRTASQVL